jgi:hypothetical protein
MGLLMPLVEGLAVFAQLDYEVADDATRIPSPIALAADFSSLGLKTPNEYMRDVYRTIQWQERYCGLVERLLVDRACDPAYFVGYLYVKSVQAHLRKRIRSARDPAFFLPFAIKLFFDHPALRTAKPSDLLSKIHDTVLTITDSQGKIIDSLYRRRSDFRAYFASWDLYSFLSSPGDAPLRYFDLDSAHWHRIQSNVEAARLDDEFNMFRACAQVYYPAWTRGTLHHSDGDTFVVSNSDSRGRELSVPRMSRSWLPYWRDAIKDDSHKLAERYRQRMRGVPMERIRAEMVQAVRKTKQAEDKWFAALDSAKGGEVTVAVYMTATEGSTGVALWTGSGVYIYPYYPDIFMPEGYKDIELELIRLAVTIPPQERLAFGAAIPNSAELAKATLNSCDQLLAHLVSNPKLRYWLKARFTLGPFSASTEELKEWSRSLTRMTARPPKSLICAGNLVFDFPGFSSPKPAGRPTFADLLPPQRALDRPIIGGTT